MISFVSNKIRINVLVFLRNNMNVFSLCANFIPEFSIYLQAKAGKRPEINLINRVPSLKKRQPPEPVIRKKAKNKRKKPKRKHLVQIGAIICI